MTIYAAGSTGSENFQLQIDGVTLNSAKYETEASTVYSTGTWDASTNGRLPGFRQSESLHYNGYLQFGAAGSTLQIRAADRTGEEQMQLQIGGTPVATFNISEQRGTVRVVQNGQLLTTPFLDISSRVNFVQDRRMLGVAVHPNFPATPYI